MLINILMNSSWGEKYDRYAECFDSEVVIDGLKLLDRAPLKQNNTRFFLQKLVFSFKL